MTPDLEFKGAGFVGEPPKGWSITPAKLACTKITDGTHDTPTPTTSGHPYITAIHVKNGRIDFENCLYLSNEDHQEVYKRCNPEKGDLAIVNIGAGVANCGYVDVDFQFSMKNVALFKPNPKILNHLYLLHLHQARQKRIAHVVRSGGAQPFLSLQDLRKLPILLPPLSEQKKIAEILSTWDRAIEVVERLIENSQAQKKALMQQLLTGKKRLPGFSGEWEVVPLTDVVRIETGSSNREDSTEEGEFTFFDRSTDVRRSDRFLFDTEAIIVGGEGQEFVPKYFIGKFDLHQRAYAIFNFKEVNGQYIFYSIHYNRHLLKRFSVGSTVASLRMGTFKKLPIRLIPKSEQEAIAAILRNYDLKLEKQNRILKRLKSEKSALMQQLLTGKRRVKIDEDVANA